MAGDAHARVKSRFTKVPRVVWWARTVVVVAIRDVVTDASILATVVFTNIVRYTAVYTSEVCCKSEWRRVCYSRSHDKSHKFTWDHMMSHDVT